MRQKEKTVCNKEGTTDSWESDLSTEEVMELVINDVIVIIQSTYPCIYLVFLEMTPFENT